MSRRGVEPAELIAGRELLRERAAVQQAALTAFWSASARAGELRAELESVEVEQRRHAAALAESTGVDTAAELLGWSRSRVAEAHKERRPGRARAEPPSGTSERDS